MRSLSIVLFIGLLTACGSTTTADSDTQRANRGDGAPPTGAAAVENIHSVYGKAVEEVTNEALARRLIAALGTSAYDAVAAEIIAPSNRVIRDEFEHLHYNAMGSEIEAAMDPLARAIPDRKNEIDVLVAEGSILMLRYHITGTHLGNFYGIAPTSNTFKIPSVAMLRFSEGKVISTWYMADEVGLLRQIGQRMPTRNDGQWILPPVKGGKAQAANDIHREMLANPEDTQVFKNKLQVVTRRTSPRPEASVYRQITRRGHYHIIDAGERYGDPEHGFGGAFSERSDKIEYIIGNEEIVAIKFRLTANNTGNMFGLPPTNTAVDNWEVSFAWFENGEWTDAWFYGDDMGMLKQLGGTQEYFIPQPGAVQPSAQTE